MAMSSFGKWLQKQRTNNNTQQINSQCWGKSIPPTLWNKWSNQPNMQKQETLMRNPCPSQPLETDQSQTHFSSCIRNLHWACWMNLEPHKMVILPAIPLQPKLYIKRLPGYAKGETSGPFMRSDVLFQVISPPPIYWTNLEPQMWLYSSSCRIPATMSLDVNSVEFISAVMGRSNAARTPRACQRV